MTGPVVVDLQAVQSPGYRGRGIAVAALEYTLALLDVRPDLVGAVWLNPELPPPGDIEPLVASGKIVYAGGPFALDTGSVPPGARIFHTTSPFELHTPLEQVWPRVSARRGQLLVATAHDLIPLELADHYLAEPGQRRRYRTRLELLRAADLVLAVSEAAAGQVHELAGIERSRIAVVGSGVSPRYKPATARGEALGRAAELVEGLREGFVLYPGGTDFRKNVEGLLRAFAEVPGRAGRQLVVACNMEPHARRHFEHVARTLRIDDDVLLTGYVPDEALLALYQSAELVVFPSLSEGYGLPLSEAMACGAPVLGSDIAALRDRLGEGQRFDPLDRDSMAAVIGRALGDEAWRDELRARSAELAVPSWHDVAVRGAAAYEALLGRPPHRWRRRPAVAFVTPLPPAPTGIAHHSLHLARALAATGRVDLDLFADGLDREPYSPAAPEGVEVFSAHRLEAVERLRGGYDRVVYALGNSDNHVGALGLLRRRPGVVVAHDVRMSNLYRFGAKDPAAVPGGLAGTIRRIYGGRFPEELGEDGWLTPEDEERYGVLMIREIVGLAEKVLFSSREAARLAALDAGEAAAGKLGVLTFAAEPPALGAGGFDADPDGGAQGAGPGAGNRAPAIPETAHLVVSLGIVHPIRRPLALVEAFPEVLARLPDAHLAIVGPAPAELVAELRGRAEELGIARAVTVTGQVPTAEFLAWMGAAALAVQLRASWNGEAASTVGECIAAGLPVAVSDLGWMRELPDEVVAKVSSGTALGPMIAGLLEDPARRAAMRAAGLGLAKTMSFEAAAEELLAHLEEGTDWPDLYPLRTARKARRTGSRSAGRS